LSGQAKPAELVARYVNDAPLAEHIAQVEAAFPHYELIADDLIAERDLVALRGRFLGVHGGAFAGIEPTGRSVSSVLMIIYRVADGRIVDHWLYFDGAALVTQLTEAPAAYA
jgi:predicted ester cyclase